MFNLEKDVSMLELLVELYIDVSIEYFRTGLFYNIQRHIISEYTIIFKRLEKYYSVLSRDINRLNSEIRHHEYGLLVGNPYSFSKITVLKQQKAKREREMIYLKRHLKDAQSVLRMM